MFEKYIEGLLSILKIDTTQQSPAENAPFGKNNAECLCEVLKMANNFGFETYNNEGYYGTAVVGEGIPFAILGHLDVVPIGNDWTKNPLGEILNDTLYGRGVLDDKGPILACLYATKQLLNEGLVPKRQIKFIFGCNEESGWACIEKFNQCEEMPLQGFSPDSDFPVINCEKGIVYYDVALPMPKDICDINGGSRANVVMDSVYAKITSLDEKVLDIAVKHDVIVDTSDGIKLVAKGRSAHGSTPQKGDNACWKLVACLSEYLGGVWSKLQKFICNSDGQGLNIALKDEQSGVLTMNVGKIYCKDDSLHFTLDIRYPISYTKDDIFKRISATLKGWEVVETMCHNSLFISPESPLVKTLLSCYEEVTSEKGLPITIGGGTYARALKEGVAFGPIFPNMTSTIHQADECAKLSELKKMYDIYYLAIKRLCF